MILRRNPSCITQVLDELEAVTDRQDLRSLDVLDIVGELPAIATELDAIAKA
jgi:hypothetical protein